ncbi:MAG: hypothetical protein ACRD4K_15885 [Candidatus Acidiferrales bacterium]
MVRAVRLTYALGISFALFTGAATASRNSVARPAAERTKLLPHFKPRDVYRYQVDLRTSTFSQSTGPIADPQGSSKLDRVVTATVRLEVLKVETEANHSGQRIRLRTTYEQSSAKSKSDSYDPQEDEIEKQYKNLEGHSLEFTLEADGTVTEIEGLKDIMSDESAVGAVREWLTSMTAGSSLPKQGIAIGEKWSTEKPIDGAPLAGLAWRTESTYLRNEPCFPGENADKSADPTTSADPGPAVNSQPASHSRKRSTLPPASPVNAQEGCAMILTKFEMVDRHGSGDPTPLSYSRNSLRTAGKWTGTGESLTTISLRTGMVVSLTQTGSEDIDFTISAATTPSKIHYAGKIQTQSHISLVPATRADSPQR